MRNRWTLIQNPMSCSGKGAKHWPQIEAQLNSAGIDFVRHTTQRAGHAIELTHQAIAEGARHLVAVGGDGTMNEVLNGIMTQTHVPPHEIILTQIPIGTGNDWRKTVGIPTDYAACIALLKDWKVIAQDVGKVEWTEAGSTRSRYFANVAGMGFEAAVGIKANNDKAAGKSGIMGYVSALLSTLIRYECTEASFHADGKALAARPFFSMALGICNFNGGGMKQCPEARYDDGLFDLTLINKVSKFTVIANVPRLFSGKFVRLDQVDQLRMKQLKVTTSDQTLLEVDGENIGQGSATFTVVPLALQVAVPK